MVGRGLRDGFFDASADNEFGEGGGGMVFGGFGVFGGERAGDETTDVV